MGLLLMSVVIVGMGVPESMAGLFHDNWKLCCVGERKRGSLGAMEWVSKPRDCHCAQVFTLLLDANLLPVTEPYRL